MESMEITSKTISVRPQPLGIFSGPAALLLLPETTDPGQRTALAELLSGNCNAEMPDEWRFFQKAVSGDIEAARKCLSRDLHSPRDQDDSAIGLHEYNLFVLSPTEERYEALRDSLPIELSQMLDVAAFNAGLIATLPMPFELDGELLAWALASVAANEIERENYSAARENLAKAIDEASQVSPLLSAILIAQSAQVAHRCLALPLGLLQKDYEAAIAIAKNHKLTGFVAELWTQLGMVLQESATTSRAALPAAIRAYQAALQSPVQPETQPQLFAELHNNLGLAYLALPESGNSNQLRTGIAIQSFRSALAAINPETDRDLWARIKMNMANALQYAPSSHPEGNLIQAVAIYEDVLSVRTRARDPVAYALVLINQANALAHLGIFKPAMEKASEAYKLFQWYEQAEQAATARELVELVNEALASGKLSKGELSSESTVLTTAIENN